MDRLPINALLFIDGGDPREAQKAKELLGYIDGQTTNPTLISKNPQVQERLTRGERLTKKEALNFYKKIVTEIAKITDGPISIEVYADKNTTSKEMLEQAEKLVVWTKNTYIKFPTNKEGLQAAQVACQKFSINMTLCFSQEQAAAVYSATKEARYEVFISPFIGRLDDRGENGMDLVKNILDMYQNGDGHVKVLTASVRSIQHILYAIKLKSPALTIPFKVFQEWATTHFVLPDENFQYKSVSKSIPYQKLSLDKPWQEYHIRHELTDIGMERFSADWNSLIRD